MEETVRARFAPSPTGHLHIGNVHTGLFNWLFAKHHGGTFILRIEDTDLQRSSMEAGELILDDLRWLGLDWDEGVDVGGPYGPYRQTERLDIYKEHLRVLLENGQAYLCYCTEEELESERKAALARGETPRYGGRCRNLGEQDRERLAGEGRKPTIRFRVPDEIIIVSDLIRGSLEFDSKTIGDFVIWKSDGTPTYNFAVVVDDACMKITHVIRADEHIANTPRQVLIYDALGLRIPRFAHVPMIFGQDRAKLSKRHGATSVAFYRKEGYLPEAIVNYLVLLGWSPESGDEIMSLDEIIGRFSLDRVGKSPAVFDVDKLNWIGAQYIRRSDIYRLTDLAIPHLKKAGLIDNTPVGEAYQWLARVVDSIRGNLSYMSQVVDHARIFFGEKVDVMDEKAVTVLRENHVSRVLGEFLKRVEGLFPFDPEAVHSMLNEIPEELDIGKRKAFLPVRVALTGRTEGPELYNVISLLGKERAVSRVKEALAHGH